MSLPGKALDPHFYHTAETRKLRTLTHMAQYLCRREDHVLCEIGILHDLAIHLRHQSLATAFVIIWAHEDGPNRCESIKGFCVEELAC